MAMQCASCGKGVMYGHNVSHAKNRTNRVFRPNLHSARVVIEGVGKRMKLCTKCLRMYKRVQKAVEAQTQTPVETVDTATVTV